MVSGLVIDDAAARAARSTACSCACTQVRFSPGIYQWHVKDVIAVFEVKKNLFGGDLSDAYLHLRDVLADL